MLLRDFLLGLKSSKYLATKDAKEYKNAESFLEQYKETEDAVPDSVYYDMIVAEARNRKDPRLSREAVKPVVEHLFQKHGIPFDESKFNQAFHEFRVANANRMVYRNG